MEELDISGLQKEFILKTLDIKDVEIDPIIQFETWFREATESGEDEPNIMILSTASMNGKPSSRAVLLKQIKPEGFIFFSNYESRKGRQLEANPYTALNFVWKNLDRQVRIEGVTSKISVYDSDRYFDNRPSMSRLGAWASPQSKAIPDREFLEKRMTDFKNQFGEKEIARPENWGGYIVRPYLMEFWQGRENRLHDRIQYTSENDVWKIERLAP